MGHEKIQFYEVAEGGIVNDRPYTGLILREEQVYNADNSGYINYYLREGKRASVGSRVYSLDETGRLDSLLKEHGVENQTLSDENLADLKTAVPPLLPAVRTRISGRFMMPVIPWKRQ